MGDFVNLKWERPALESQDNNEMMKDHDNASRIRRNRFIAQEVEEAAKKSGYNFSGIITPGKEQKHYSLSYESFVVPLVKAVQEQQKIILSQEQKIATQEQKIAAQEQINATYEKKLSALQKEMEEIKKLVKQINK